VARVFISSTCYDLVDVRAEVKALIEDMGFDAQLSEDDLDSAFEVSGEIDKTSIQECLDNVNTCDCFVLILSQRYGPSLGKADYDDVSATHLEYREFVRRKERGDKVKLFVYVRDRLAQDFSTWKANRKQPIKHHWVPEKDAERLFTFLEEVSKLNAHAGKDGTNNWFTRFRDSTTLKDVIRRHLNVLSSRALLGRLVRDRRMALIGVTSPVPGTDQQSVRDVAFSPINHSGLKPGDSFTAQIKFRVTNLGEVVALNLKLTATPEQDFGLELATGSVGAMALAPGATADLLLDVKARLMKDMKPGDQRRVPVRCAFEYMLPTGEVIRDTNEVGVVFHAKSHVGRGNLPPAVTQLRVDPSGDSSFVGKEFIRLASDPNAPA
jgi:hypothetical protein